MNRALQDIQNAPTVIDNVHESCYRAFMILRYVEHLLEENTPPQIALELLRELHYGVHAKEDRRTEKVLRDA